MPTKVECLGIQTLRRRQWHPTPILLLGKSHGRRSLVGCSPWGRWELDTTEWLHFHFSLSCSGEGNGNPLQCSCLENPRVGGAWWAAVYGVAQSRTRLKWLSIAQHPQWSQMVPLHQVSSHGSGCFRYNVILQRILIFKKLEPAWFALGCMFIPAFCGCGPIGSADFRTSVVRSEFTEGVPHWVSLGFRQNSILLFPSQNSGVLTRVKSIPAQLSREPRSSYSILCDRFHEICPVHGLPETSQLPVSSIPFLDLWAKVKGFSFYLCLTHPVPARLPREPNGERLKNRKEQQGVSPYFWGQFLRSWRRVSFLNYSCLPSHHGLRYHHLCRAAPGLTQENKLKISRYMYICNRLTLLNPWN